MDGVEVEALALGSENLKREFQSVRGQDEPPLSQGEKKRCVMAWLSPQ